MNTYNVHIYREARFYVEGIEAKNAEEAAYKAAQMPDEDFQGPFGAQGVSIAAMVDLQGDEDFEHTRSIDFEAGKKLEYFDDIHHMLRKVQAWLYTDLIHPERAPSRDTAAKAYAEITRILDKSIL